MNIVDGKILTNFSQYQEKEEKTHQPIDLKICYGFRFFLSSESLFSVVFYGSLCSVGIFFVMSYAILLDTAAFQKRW